MRKEGTTKTVYLKNVLASRMKLAEIGQVELAKKVGVNVSTLNKKINGSVEFKLREIQRIADVLDLTDQDIISIFFADEVA